MKVPRGCDFCLGESKDEAYLELVNHKTGRSAWFCCPQCLSQDIDDFLDEEVENELDN